MERYCEAILSRLTFRRRLATHAQTQRRRMGLTVSHGLLLSNGLDRRCEQRRLEGGHVICADQAKDENAHCFAKKGGGLVVSSTAPTVLSLSSSNALRSRSPTERSLAHCSKSIALAACWCTPQAAKSDTVAMPTVPSVLAVFAPTLRWAVRVKLARQQGATSRERETEGEAGRIVALTPRAHRQVTLAALPQVCA